MTKNRLDDLLAPELQIVFVAINPSPLSVDRGGHFSSPTNPFWKLLHASGLTSRLFRPEDAPALVHESLGLTSLVRRPTAAASELTRDEKTAGAAQLRKTIERWRPKTVALLGLTLFPIVFPDVTERGPGLKEVRLGEARVFVLPNPSGRNRAYPGFAAKLVWYEQLAQSSLRRKLSTIDDHRPGR